MESYCTDKKISYRMFTQQQANLLIPYSQTSILLHTLYSYSLIEDANPNEIKVKVPS